nr:TRAP transporter large permease [Salicibibacter halophilus]
MAFAIGIVAYVGIVILDTIPVTMVVQSMFAGLESFVLIAVPLFILAANIMNKGDISERLINLAIALIGHIRGGLAQANIVVSMFFGGISGAAQADTAGVGKVLIPSMIRENYSKDTSVAVTAASSTMGIIIPPSIPMVVYGGLTNVSVGQMFMGGIIPGVLMGLGMMAMVGYMSHRHQYPRHKRLQLKEIAIQAVKSIPPLLTPVIILGGIIGGFVTPTEAAILACLYAFILAYFFYRTIKIKDLPGILYDTLMLSSLTLFALATATALGRLISYYNVPVIVSGFFETALPYEWMFLLTVILLFLFIGMFLDTIPAIILFVPIVLPTAMDFGIDPVHFGIIIMMCLAVGLVTPPYGLCLLLASSIAKLPIGRSFIALLPYIGITILVILIISFVPQLFMWVPEIMR